ncbi:MAG: nitrogenase component 1 [Lachnospiraceae bacterium]|nr:nitrogenase component 1 [Lachnospiraceae bacterium]
MKRLWKVLPPCLSDLMGFEAVVNETEGLGLIDDSSTYKPLMFGRGGHGRPGMEDRPERGGHPLVNDSSEVGSHPWAAGNLDRGKYVEMTGHPDRDKRAEMTGRPDREGRPEVEDHHGHGGGRGGFGRLMPGMRVLNSDIRNEDIITGTEKKVMLAFDKGVKQLSPNFVLLAYGPSASMIGSDLEYAAEKITKGSAFVQQTSMDEPASLQTDRVGASVQSGLPAAAVKIDGEKDYLYGISCTLEAMGRLFLKSRPTIPGSLNILGANTIDWAKESFADLETLLAQEGFQILSRWGWKETTENLKLASAAALNLVVNESGLRLAKYMESEYGIPYLAGAPFGADFAETLKIRLKEAVPMTDTERPGEKQRKECRLSESAAIQNGDLRKENDVDTEPEVLIVGEQFMANAIRRELCRRGEEKIRVLSFYDMDKAYMEPGDRKLTGEDDFARQADTASVRMILADGDLQPLVKKEVRWVRLPNTGGMFPVESMDAFPMTGGALDAWLDREGL